MAYHNISQKPEPRYVGSLYKFPLKGDAFQPKYTPMAYPQITFRIATSLALFSTLYLHTHAVISGFPQHNVERRDLVCGLSTLKAPSCSEVCVTAFWDDKCVNEVSPFGEFATTLEVTDGVIKPLIWPADIKSQGNGSINGIMYFGAENTASCNPILFFFYDQQNQETGDLILMTPGQITTECEVISNAAVAYLGVEVSG